MFAPELRALKKGALKLLSPGSESYNTRLADRLMELQRSSLDTAKALARYLCGGTGKLLVICLDNCDKRNRDEQLAMFQIAQWVQREFRSLVFLPLRDITYDLHRNEPPLDTALKTLTFRIEPPRFSDVLARRIELAIKEMAKGGSAKTLEYTLPNNMRVQYPSTDQGIYLASILRSLYAYDKFLRRIMSGLAGRDIRRAMEIFLNFCTSGHIGEDQIFKMRALEGQYTIPFRLVARVLLRMHRRFYDGESSHLKNLFQCEPADASPDHFVRVSILRWLERRSRAPGPTGVMGFHRLESLVAALALVGHDADRVREECKYLLKELCVVAEHLRTDSLDDADLVALSPAGAVHLTLLMNDDYLAACAEDTYLANASLANTIAARIGPGGPRRHYANRTIRQNAEGFLRYLEDAYVRGFRDPRVFSSSDDTSYDYVGLPEISKAIASQRVFSHRIFIGNLEWSLTDKDISEFFAGNGFALSRLVLIREKDTGKSKGSAFADLDTPEAAAKAIDALNGKVLRGRPLRLDEEDDSGESLSKAKRRANPAPAIASDQLALFNIPYAATENDVKQLLDSAGVTFTRIHVPRMLNGKGKGQAFLSFASPEKAEEARKLLEGCELGGRKIRCESAYRAPDS